MAGLVRHNFTQPWPRAGKIPWLILPLYGSGLAALRRLAPLHPLLVPTASSPSGETPHGCLAESLGCPVRAPRCARRSGHDVEAAQQPGGLAALSVPMAPPPRAGTPLHPPLVATALRPTDGGSPDCPGSPYRPTGPPGCAIAAVAAVTIVSGILAERTLHVVSFVRSTSPLRLAPAPSPSLPG